MTPLPRIDGGWGTIVVDPPWRYRAGLATRIRPPYETMTEGELVALPIRELAADKALIFIWCTSSFTPEAYRLCFRWGFRPVSQIAWVKMGRTGKLQIGMGSYVRMCHELVIIGERGGQTGLVRDIPSVLIAPRGQHSVKPARLLEIAELLSPGPRIELFARSRRPGWAAWGDQAPEGDDFQQEASNG